MSTRAKRKDDESDDIFMVSYSALMILLLTFMILMVTLAQFKEPRFRKAIGSVKGAFSILPNVGGTDMMKTGSQGLLPEANLARAITEESEEEKAYRKAVQKIKKRALRPDLSGLEIEETEEGVAIRVSDELMFERGRAELKSDILPVLELVTEAIISRPGRVSIVGHTCDLPISNSEFPSNWELSVVRAVNVLHHFEKGGVSPESLYAYGVADQCPIAPNDTEENRSRNRRVEIHVTHPKVEREQHLAE
jgi:chemotaxis protein MotB